MTTAGDFDYFLPPSAIAQSPVEPRDAARLLVALDPDSPLQHEHVRDLDALVGPGDVIVVNETRVMPARLNLRKPSGGQVEVFLLEPDAADPATWVALVRPGRRVRPGTRLVGYDGTEVAEVGEELGDGRRRVSMLAPIADHGEVPLPPYIHTELQDPDRYQTVYARRPGSVAAPTAGLHLTEDLLARIRAAGADVHTVDLAVGLGTFRPLTSDDLREHSMHDERYSVPEETMAAAAGARRVIAVGTTTMRALESAALSGRLSGRTDLFITPGFQFAVVDVLLTNFHQPRSTLLVLLEAFYGPRWRVLYRAALDGGYRFLSFGDAMLVARQDAGRQ